QRAARPACPRFRPRRDRGLAAAVRRAAAGRVGRPRVSPLEARARGASRRVRTGRSPGRRVARGNPADRDPRGGERISPARTRTRTRLALASAAVVAVAGAAVYGAVAADRLAWLVLALGIGAVLLLVYGLAAPNLPAIVAALAGSAASWSLSAWTRGSGAPGGTILVATAIFVAAAPSYWSLEPISGPDHPQLPPPPTPRPPPPAPPPPPPLSPLP